MPAVWFGLKRYSTTCKVQRGDFYDPESKGKHDNLSNISTKKSSEGRSGCSKSIANLKDVVIHGSKRHTEKPPICSPRSIGSSELLNPITHDVVIDDSTSEFKISARSGGGGSGSDYVGVVKPGTPGHGEGFHVGRRRILLSPARRTSARNSGFGVVNSTRTRLSGDYNGAPICPKCGDQFLRWEAVEAHHLSKHAVSELSEGDSSRRIVEMICRARAENSRGIERIVKVHNMQKTVAQFEEYREVVKIRASRLAKKHPRCLADGNELLRFHGATVECPLGMKGSCSLCTSDRCRVCLILRHGFSTKGGIGVFTASTSRKAFESIQLSDDDSSLRKALIVCRVIAGRVHRPLDNMQEMVGQSGFDSLAGRVGVHSNIEELYLLSHRALLPCFVAIYKP